MNIKRIILAFMIIFISINTASAKMIKYRGIYLNTDKISAIKPEYSSGGYIRNLPTLKVYFSGSDYFIYFSKSNKDLSVEVVRLAKLINQNK